MDELVTQLIEDQVSTLEGVKSMSSTTSEGRSMIMLEYDYDTDMDEAYSDLTKSLNSIRDLPDDVEPTGHGDEQQRPGQHDAYYCESVPGKSL